MDILNDIESAIEKFKRLTNDEKAKEITDAINKLANKKDGVFKKYFENENTDIEVNEMNKNENASYNKINDRGIISFNKEKIFDDMEEKLKNPSNSNNMTIFHFSQVLKKGGYGKFNISELEKLF